MRRSRAAVVVAVAGLLATGCTDDGAPRAVPEPAQTTASRPHASELTDTDAEPEVLRTDEELLDPEPVPLGRWEPFGEGVLRLHVSSGTPECFGAAVDLEEDAEEIRVGVSVGVLASAAELDCVAVAVGAVVDVALDSPVGDRDVVDTNS